jgi:hypothetical protein
VLQTGKYRVLGHELQGRLHVGNGKQVIISGEFMKTGVNRIFYPAVKEISVMIKCDLDHIIILGMLGY